MSLSQKALVPEEKSISVQTPFCSSDVKASPAAGAQTVRWNDWASWMGNGQTAGVAPKMPSAPTETCRRRLPMVASGADTEQNLNSRSMVASVMVLPEKYRSKAIGP